jgi:hypothetical protein
MPLELRHRLAVLGIGRGRSLEAGQTGFQPGQVGGAEFRPEGRRLSIGIQSEEKIVAGLDHAGQQRLGHGIAGIDQDVIGLEAGPPRDWGCRCEPGIFAPVPGPGVEREVDFEVGGDGGNGTCVDIMEISKPDDLGDVANLGVRFARAAMGFAG